MKSQPLKHALKSGAKAGWPICLGYIPIGLTFGVLAQKSGLSPVQIMLMSIIVFAGSSQFIAAAMIASGASAISIIATTFVVNFRHLLMSASLAVPLAGTKKSLLAVFSYGVTDESFAVNLSRFQNESWGIFPGLVVNHAANLTWIVCTTLGGIGGQFIPAGAFGMDFALSAMFICLLVFQLNPHGGSKMTTTTNHESPDDGKITIGRGGFHIKGKIYMLTGLLSGTLSVGLSLMWPGNLHIVLASVIAAAAGTILLRPDNLESINPHGGDKKPATTKHES